MGDGEGMEVGDCVEVGDGGTRVGEGLIMPGVLVTPALQATITNAKIIQKPTRRFINMPSSTIDKV